MSYPESMVQLIEEFAKLPGVGRRTAERFAFYFLSARKEDVETLSRLLLRVNTSVHFCEVCFNLSEGPTCHICSDSTRDHSTVCVVADPKDVIAIEKSADYRGIYHVLQGVLSPLEGIGPKDLRIKELCERLIKNRAIAEVILAMSSDTEGDATSFYLMKQLKAFKVKVSRIAHGVPVGSALEFADKATLSRAIRERQLAS